MPVTFITDIKQLEKILNKDKKKKKNDMTIFITKKKNKNKK